MATSLGYVVDLQPPSDEMLTSAEKRDWASRWLVLGIVVVLAAAIPIGFITAWGWIAGATDVGFILGLFAAPGFVAPAVYRSYITNAEWTAYVTQDPFSGLNVPYGPGWHPCFIWERRNKNGNYPLKVIAPSQVLELGVPSKTARVTAKIRYSYAISLPDILQYIGVADKMTLEKGIEGFMNAFLSAELAGKTAEESREQLNVINQRLADAFMHLKNDDQITVVDFQKKFGIIIVSVIIENFVLPSDAQATRDALDEAETLFKVVAVMIGLPQGDVGVKELQKRLGQGEGGLTPNDPGYISPEEFRRLRAEAMGISKNARFDVSRFEVDFPQLTPEVASAIAPFAAAFASRQGRGRRGRGNRDQRQQQGE